MRRSTRYRNQWLREFRKLYSRWPRHNHDIILVFIAFNGIILHPIFVAIHHHPLVFYFLLKVTESFASLTEHEQLCILLEVLERVVFDVSEGDAVGDVDFGAVGSRFQDKFEQLFYLVKIVANVGVDVLDELVSSDLDHVRVLCCNCIQLFLLLLVLYTIRFVREIAASLVGV